MACSPEILRRVLLFGRLDDEETAVWAGQVELKTFAPRQRIYKIGDPGGRAYVMVSGRVRVATIDEDTQEVVVDEPTFGEFFRLRLHARADAASNRSHLAGRNCLPRSGPPGHHCPFATQAARRHGHAHRARPPVPRLATTSARPRQSPSQRNYRRGNKVR